MEEMVILVFGGLGTVLFGTSSIGKGISISSVWYKWPHTYHRREPVTEKLEYPIEDIERIHPLSKNNDVGCADSFRKSYRKAL